MTARGQENLPSNTEVNPRDVKAITLRSSKELKSRDEMDKCVTTEKEAKNKDSYGTEQKETMGKSVETDEEKVPKSSPPLAPKIPFPHRLRKQKDGEQFSKFLEIFKNYRLTFLWQRH